MQVQQQQQDMHLQPNTSLDASFMQNGQSSMNTSQYPNNSNQISSVDQSASNMMMVRSQETRRILNMSGA